MSEKNWTNSKFEFLFKINDNIICQRNFGISDYNKDVLKSDEIKDMMDAISGMNNGEWGELGIIPKFLKQESKRYLWKRYNPYVPQNQEDISKKDIFHNEDVFTVEIKVDNRIVASSIFSGNWFPTSVRYHVNINGRKDEKYNSNRNIIPDIIATIRDYFSRKSYTYSNTKFE